MTEPQSPSTVGVVDVTSRLVDVLERDAGDVEAVVSFRTPCASFTRRAGTCSGARSSRRCWTPGSTTSRRG